MYSRNFTFDNSSSGVRLTPTNQSRQPSHQEKVPVRSFTDGFAYERFNRMGEVREQTPSKDYPVEYSDEQINIGEKDTIQTKNVQNTDFETSIGVSEIVAKQDKMDEKISFLSKVKSLFDSDTILIIFAVIMILFSDNATNDKLTPFALLAILFL